MEHEHQHGHGHGQEAGRRPGPWPGGAAEPDWDSPEMFTAEFWNTRYGSADAIWSGNPNPQLVANVTGLTPGSALEVGSGEGADAIWLAEQGWRVTGVDVSTVALDRAARRAATSGADVAGRISWQQADLTTWDPAPARFDLVSAQFMYLPGPELPGLHRRLAAAVLPGGTLLIVGHHPSDLETLVPRPKRVDHMYTAEQVAEGLDGNEWEIFSSTPARRITDPDGNEITIHDAVLRAVRRP